MTGYYRHKCPSCGAGFLGITRAETVCPACQVERLAKLRELEARYPSAEQLGLEGSKGDRPARLCKRPTASGRRVIRKSEPMAG